MKYIVICIVTFGICIFGGYLISRLFKRRFGEKHIRLKIAAVTLAAAVLIMAGVTVAYLSINYSAGEDAQRALEGNDLVQVSHIEGGYFFDGPSDENALIFYQGGKVDEKAYSELMLRIAEKGADCFLAEMPLDFAIFGGSFADKFISLYSYENYFMAGHSMGGVMAASYTASHENSIKGVVLLASYSIEKLSDNIRLYSIYGEKDGCLNKEAYERNMGNWPKGSSEIIIRGGNHCGFADYGMQKGDNKADISREEQIEETAEYILELIDSVG